MTSFPIFDSEKLWTYKEELHLLQFIEQYGYDNWEEIAKHLPNRTAQGKLNTRPRIKLKIFIKCIFII